MANNLFAELTRITRDVYFGKCYEPEPRNKDGFRYIRHRFPIKGGISYLEAQSKHNFRLIEGLSRNEP